MLSKETYEYGTKEDDLLWFAVDMSDNKQKMKSNRIETKQ